MGLENFPPKNISEQPIEKPTAGRMDFTAMAENLNPEIAKLEQELSQLVRRIASIREQMKGGRYAGKLTDLPNAEAERDLLKQRIEVHPDFGSKQKKIERDLGQRQGFERNLTGRDDRINNRWN